MPNSNSSLDKNAFPFIVVIVLVLGILLGYLGTSVFKGASLMSETNSASSSSSNYFDQSYIDKIYSSLNESYLGTIPSKSEITQGLVKGLITSLDDPYTSYLTPEEATAYNSSKDPDFEGIGVSLKFDGENTEVESVIEGNPAQKAGIKSGDIISMIDGVSVLGQTPTAVASKIRGEKGTVVGLKVYRKEDNGQGALVDFQITRAKIDIDNISFKSLGNGIFKINITQFTDSSADMLNRSWDKIVNEILQQDANPKGIVVDLRNNPGGYVYSLRYILEEFFKSGTTLMQEQKKNTETVIYKDERVGKFENIPVSVIVNEGSASASEIFAAAFQDNARGQVVGMKTVGKGVEQTLITGDDGSMLILVFQKWLTPSGNQISKDKPITPNFEIDYKDADVKAGKDPQLDKALELIK